MPLRRFRRLCAQSLVTCGGVAAIGCSDRSAPPLRTETAVAVPGSESAATTGTRVASGWSLAAGPALLVQGETREEAIVLLPFGDDSATEARLMMLAGDNAPVSMIGRGGAQFTAILGRAPTSADPECRVWPLRSVQGEADGIWSVGFIGATIQPIALDSIDLLSSRDSAALAAEASRLASGVTALTAPSFQGLRFSAHDVRRFQTLQGVQALVAHVVRKVNQEANPQEEQTLLIAERDSGATSGPYQLVYAERTHGLEESVTTPEVIAGVSVAGRPMLVVARETEAGVAYGLLERTGPRQWRVRWTSGLTRCG